MNIAVLASGEGTNFEAIVRNLRRGKLRGVEIKVLITDKKNAPVRRRAEKYKIKDIFVDSKSFLNREEFDAYIVKLIKQEKVDLVVLAGFMRILGPLFVNIFKNKILNIHPALLPAFKGVFAIRQAHTYGAKVTGVTVHFVDSGIDHGPIILQQALKIKEGESLGDLEHRIHNLEHKLYTKAIKLYVDGRISIRKRKVIIRKGLK